MKNTSIRNWSYTEQDRELAEELEVFLPERIFDAHAHLCRVSDLHVDQTSFWSEGPAEISVAEWQSRLGHQLGESRLKGALFISAPTANCELDRVNGYLLKEVEKTPNSRGLIVLKPDTPRDVIEEYAPNPLIAGLKPYHLFSTEKPTWESSIGGFLPEWAWEIADRQGWVITLHMVRRKAIADPENLRYIREMCLSYPNARLVLAHCARGFHAPNTVNGVSELRGIDNLWFDTSGVCEAAPIMAILHEFGPRKLMWGSDFPVSEQRGRAVTTGDGFVWLLPDTVAWDNLMLACNPVLVGLESVRALQEAARHFPLTETDIEDIFCNNAERLLGLAKEPSGRTQALYDHAKDRIPGGVQLLSKRPEMHAPNQWPPYFSEARGCEVWDIDGRHYFDMSTNGIGSCLLGYCNPMVNRAVERRIRLGSMSTLNPPEEVELADRLCEIHPWAEQARFARSGGETAAIAVRIARATTDRSIVAICGYHGWHDWYLAANLGESDSLRGHLLPGLDPLGVPRELRGTARAFRYNDFQAFQEILNACGDKLAAVIMEPCRYNDPEPGFLEAVRDGAHSVGALLIFDEITIGWRLNYGGAHLRLGVNPDMAIFAKALGNGFPIGAVIGTRAAMEGANGSFISSTYWTESIGPTAALATLKAMAETDVPANVRSVGERITRIWQDGAAKHGVKIISGDGYPCLAHFRFDHELSDEIKTLYTQLMLERGFLAGLSIYPTTAHTDEVIDRYAGAVEEVFARISDAISSGSIKQKLAGPVAHSTFRRLL